MAMAAENLATAKDGDGLYKRAAEITEMSNRTLEDYKRLSEQFEITLRHVNLSYNHHREVASIKATVVEKGGTLALAIPGIR